MEGDDGKKGIGQGGIWLNARVQNPPQKKNRKEKNLDEKKGGKIKISKKKKKTKKRGSIFLHNYRAFDYFLLFFWTCMYTPPLSLRVLPLKNVFFFFFLDYRPCAHISQCFSIYSFLLVPPMGCIISYSTQGLVLIHLGIDQDKKTFDGPTFWPFFGSYL